MSENDRRSRRAVLKAGMGVAVACLATRPTRSQANDNEHDQPKLDRIRVHYQDHPGPDNHQGGLYTNVVTPASCRVGNGAVLPTGSCLSFAPKDVDP